jgi:hypothetical protein
VLASFAEGFGAYGMPLYPTADFPVQAIPVASKESLQHHGGRELTATAHGYEAGLLSRPEISSSLARARRSTHGRHGTGICWRLFMMRALRYGLIGAGNGRSSGPSRPWRNSTIGRCEI